MLYLVYDPSKWEELSSVPLNTLQLFITNRCDLSCKDCFYKSRLGPGDMSFDDYREYIENHLGAIQKIILLGGEPTLHKDLPRMIEHNNSLGIKTTIYTNGNNFDIFNDANISNTSIRVSVYGTNQKEKSIRDLKVHPNIPIMLIYMLKKDNVSELTPAINIAEDLGIKKVFISSIRDIARSGDYWRDTPDTLPFIEYAKVIKDFISNYNGNMEINISRRGILKTIKSGESFIDKCRFGNIFPNDDKIICPFDICKNIKTDKLVFNQRQCNKNTECLLRKITLKRI